MLEKIRKIATLHIYRNGDIADKISPNWFNKDISEVIADIDNNLKKTKNSVRVQFLAKEDFSDSLYASIKSDDYADFKEFKQAVKDSLARGACTLESTRVISKMDWL